VVLPAISFDEEMEKTVWEELRGRLCPDLVGKWNLAQG